MAGRPRDSRSTTPLRLTIFLGALAAAALMIAAEFSTLFAIDVVTASCEDLADPRLTDSCVTTGGEHHSYALLVLGVFTVPMAWGAGLGESRPAAVALVLLGAVVLAITLAIDLPDAKETGAVGSNFDQADARAGIGLWMQLIGGTLAVAAGALALLTRRSD